LNDRLQVNWDVYLYEYKNYQVDQLEYFRARTAGVRRFHHECRECASQGMELETQALLTRH